MLKKKNYIRSEKLKGKLKGFSQILWNPYKDGNKPNKKKIVLISPPSVMSHTLFTWPCSQSLDLRGHVLYMRAETAEASDMLHGQMNNLHDVPCCETGDWCWSSGRPGMVVTEIESVPTCNRVSENLEKLFNNWEYLCINSIVYYMSIIYVVNNSLPCIFVK